MDAIFGKAHLRSDYSDCVIVVRHGFKSDHRPFVKVSNQLRGSFTGAVVDNEDYTWTKPVLENGVELALLHILNKYEDSQPLCLIGHSMGGLVCRVENLALTRTVEFQNYMAVLSIAGGPSYLDPVQKLVAQLRQREVVEVWSRSRLRTPRR